jgi:hypothetical protein
MDRDSLPSGEIYMTSKTYRNDGIEGRPTTIATTVSWVLDPANLNGGNGVIKDYMSSLIPYNSLFIRNNGSNEIEAYPNGSYARMISLPQGATVTKLNEPFNFIILKNIGSGTVATKEITVLIEKLEKAK